jgi:hypothetical protein
MRPFLKTTYWLTALATVLFGSCVGSLRQVGYPNEVQIAKFKQLNKNNNPIIFGLIKQEEQDGHLSTVQIASIIADGNVTQTRPNGYYSCTLSPGNHTLAVKWLGLRSVVIKQLSLHKGDSLNINFLLVSDTTKYVN